MIDIKRLIFDKSLNQRILAQILGCQQSEVSLFANRKRSMSDSQVEALIAHFGRETIDAYTIPDRPFDGITKDAQVTILDPATVQEIKNDMKAMEAIPILPTEVATEPEQDIREYIAESGNELERINPSHLLRHADLAEKVLHTSMFPTFQPEDIIFIRFIPSQMEIVDGNTYYIDSKIYPTLIRRVKVEGDRLRLIAQNKQFADIYINRADVHNIGSIVGLLRMNFGNQYDEMEELRHKKDSHLERMMEMLERSAEQQGKLIDRLCREK